MNKIIIKNDTCRKCRLCVEVCPNKVLQVNKDNTVYPDGSRLTVCFACCQCMAVCPTRSINVNGLSYQNDFYELPIEQVEDKDFYNLILTRRSIRNYKNKAVKKEILEKIVEAISLAPIGFPPIKYKLVVVENSEIIRKALPEMIKLYDSLYNAINDPIKRQFVKHNAGKHKYKIMQEHLIPLLKIRLPNLKNGTEDTITRNAQAMILFVSDKKENISADIYVAATYGILFAHSIKLGASIMEIIPPAINKRKELRNMFKVKEDEEVITSIILGYPKHNYQRGIKRTIKNVFWINGDVLTRT